MLTVGAAGKNARSSYDLPFPSICLVRTSSYNLVFFFVFSACQHNICISNAQYSSFSAQRNPWCEIFEF